MKEIIEKYAQLVSWSDNKKTSYLVGEYVMWLLEDDNFDMRDDNDEVSIAMVRGRIDRKLLPKK